MVVQFLSKSSLIAYVRHFTQLLQNKDDENIKRFLEQCKNELDKRNGQVPEWSIGSDCKSDGCGLREFKSLPAHLIKTNCHKRDTSKNF